MNRYSLTHLPDATLLSGLTTHLGRERTATAAFLAYLAEADARRLYAAAGYPSLFAWCVERLHLSEDAAAKRIHAARAARQFPAIYPMLADGRLHLSAVILLTPHLTVANAADLLAAAVHRSKAGVEQLLAERFPRPDLPARVTPLAAASGLGPGHVGMAGPARVEHAPGHTIFSVTEQANGDGGSGDLALEAAPATVRTRVAPLSQGRYGVQFTLDRQAYETLCAVQALLGHAVPSGDVAEVVTRALAFYRTHLEKRKFAATDRPRAGSRRTPSDPRRIPAAMRREVWERDQGQCTYVNSDGHRCTARTRLEFDHAESVARGGRATVRNLRLRCRAHNQMAAEREFGAVFMSGKREQAQRDSQHARARRQTEAEERERTRAAEAEVRALAAAQAATRAEEARVRAAAAAEVIPWLRVLGLRQDEARRAAARCEAIPDASLEERLRLALSGLVPRGCRTVAPAPRSAA